MEIKEKLKQWLGNFIGMFIVIIVVTSILFFMGPYVSALTTVNIGNNTYGNLTSVIISPVPVGYANQYDCGAGNCVQSTIGGYVCVPCGGSGSNPHYLYDSSNNITIDGINGNLLYNIGGISHNYMNWFNKELHDNWRDYGNFTAYNVYGGNLCYSDGTNCKNDTENSIWINGTENSIKINSSYPQAISMNPVIIGNTSGNTRGSNSIDIQSGHYEDNGTYHSDYVCSGANSVCVGIGNKGTAKYSMTFGGINYNNGFASQVFGNLNSLSSDYSSVMGYSNIVNQTTGCGGLSTNNVNGFSNQVNSLNAGNYGNSVYGDNNKIKNSYDSTFIGEGNIFDSGDSQSDCNGDAGYTMIFGNLISDCQAGEICLGNNLAYLKIATNGNVRIKNGASYTNKVVCYLANGDLGHCTSIVGVTGGCTCVSN